MFDYTAYIHKMIHIRGQYTTNELDELDTLKSRSQSLQESLDSNYHNYTIFAVTSFNYCCWYIHDVLKIILYDFCYDKII